MYPERKDMSFRDALNFIRPEHVAFGSGAASLVSNLALSLAEEGDAVLIPAPVSCMQLKMFVFFAFSQFMLTPLLHSFTLSRFKYYAAFDADLKIMAGCIAVPVHSTNPSIGPTPADLEYAATLAEAKGLRVRILLITNPNNPLGTIYPPELIKSAIEWARSRSMHTVVDELYALSVHDQNVVFESVIRTLNNDLRNDVSNYFDQLAMMYVCTRTNSHRRNLFLLPCKVHHIWALSKDFGASGFRIGTLYSKNQRLLSSIANLNIFSGVSQPMQFVLQDVLKDDHFIYSFLENSRHRIRYSYEMCIARLDEMVIPYVTAKAGIFVYADFSSLLPEQTFSGEARFSSLLLDAARIIMTPGQAQHDRKPGMFRICYAFVSPEVLEMALVRLDRIVGKIRRWHWDNLNAAELTDIL
jgi:1-aminocyclopropane-1-carboxylate synthase